MIETGWFQVHFNHHSNGKWIVFIDEIRDEIWNDAIKKTLYKQAADKIFKEHKCSPTRCGEFDAILLSDLMDIVGKSYEKKIKAWRKRYNLVNNK